MNKQRGAVLIVSLIMLLLITAIALSTISGSTFQTAMTTNAQQRESILRVAESAAEQPLNKSTLNSAYNAYYKWKGTKDTPDRFYSVPAAQLVTGEPDVSMSSQVLFMQTANAENFDPKMFKYYVYESRGKAYSSEAGTEVDAKLATQVTQGVTRLQRAACDTYDPC